MIVGLCLERSPELVIGLLGILKAGGAFLPLDPGYPKERTSFMLKDAQSQFLLTQDSLVDERVEHPPLIIRLDADWRDIARSRRRSLRRVELLREPCLCDVYLRIHRNAERRRHAARGAV